MRMPEVMLFLTLALLSGCKEEKLARGETAPAGGDGYPAGAQPALAG